MSAVESVLGWVTSRDRHLRHVLRNTPSTVWAILISFGGAGLAWWWRTGDGFQWAGMLLQLLGISTVFWAIVKTRRDFRKPSLWASIKQWLSAREHFFVDAAFPIGSHSIPNLDVLYQRLASLENTVQRTSKDLESLLEKMAIGGLDLSAAGIVFLFFGIVMSAVPELFPVLLRMR